jgi:hypothetical protein
MHSWAPTPRALQQPAQGWRDGGAFTLGSSRRAPTPQGLNRTIPVQRCNPAGLTTFRTLFPGQLAPRNPAQGFERLSAFPPRSA